MRVLGIDASTVKCGFAVVTDGAMLLEHTSLELAKRKLHRDRRDAVAAFTSQAAAQYNVDVVVLERIRLFHRGVIKLETIVRLASLWTVIADATLKPTYTVDTRTWRRLVVGSSQATKEETVAWANRKYRLKLDDERDHDVADAIGIAVSGLLMADKQFAQFFKVLD